MEKDCTDLLETMQKQLEIYRMLLALAFEKQPVLVKGDIPELEAIIKEEELIILQVGRLEEQRSVLHLALANHFSLSPEELSLSEIVKRTEGEMSQAFQQVFEEMTGVLKDLAEINQNNTNLIKSSLEYINLTLDLLTNTDSVPVYNEQDEGKKHSAAKIFDRKI